MSNTALNVSPQWCLRFLSGAVRGRSIVLRPGTCTLGSAPDCEVLLPASDVQARHLVLQVGELALSVQRVGEAPASINGEPMAATRRSVVVGDVLTVGRIDVQIERSYPASDGASEGPDSMFADAAASSAAMPAASAPARSLRGRAWALGLGVWLAAMVLAWWAWGGAPARAAAQPPMDLAALQEALRDFPEAEVVAAGGGRFGVKGFVESQARRQALQRAVQPFGARVTVSVHSVDELIEQARRFVSDPGLAVTYAGKGTLVVSGKTEKDGVQAMVQRLAEDLHPTVLVSDRVQYVRPKETAQANAEQKEQWDAWQRALPARMVSITQDGRGMRYIQLADGSLYFEGAVLKSGVELKSLRPDAEGGTP